MRSLNPRFWSRRRKPSKGILASEVPRRIFSRIFSAATRFSFLRRKVITAVHPEGGERGRHEARSYYCLPTINRDCRLSNLINPYDRSLDPWEFGRSLSPEPRSGSPPVLTIRFARY